MGVAVALFLCLKGLGVGLQKSGLSDLTPIRPVTAIRDKFTSREVPGTLGTFGIFLSKIGED